MRYTAAHRARTKKNIIESARKLFNRHGFENVSIGQVMSGAGLTRGGFYSYFGRVSSHGQRAGAESGGEEQPRRVTAQAIAALSIAGMVVARTLVDHSHTDELRAPCIAVALALGGWEKESGSRPNE